MEKLQEVREAANAYENENAYCMDESALFWKMAPDGTLGTDQGAEWEHGKARITISLACNVTGSHKPEPWFIGKARVPRSFRGSSIKVKDFLDYVAEQQESLDDWESLYACGLIGRWQVDKLSCWLMGSRHIMLAST